MVQRVLNENDQGKAWKICYDNIVTQFSYSKEEEEQSAIKYLEEAWEELTSKKPPKEDIHIKYEEILVKDILKKQKKSKARSKEFGIFFIIISFIIFILVFIFSPDSPMARQMLVSGITGSLVVGVILLFKK